MARQVEIVREEIILVDRTENDNYGNLVVTGKDGKEIRINSKHEPIHSVFQPGVAVKVGYGSYMNREYIHTAVQVVLPPPREPGKPLPEQQAEIDKVVDRVEKAGGKVSYISVTNTKNRAFALSYAKDQVNQMMKDSPELAKKSSKDITKVTISMARDYEKYINGED